MDKMSANEVMERVEDNLHQKVKDGNNGHCLTMTKRIATTEQKITLQFVHPNHENE